MDKITADKVVNTPKTSLTKPIDKTATEESAKVNSDRALLEAEAIKNLGSSDKLVQSVNEKVSVSKPKKTNKSDERTIEDELGDDGIIRTTEKPNDTPKLSLTQSSTTASAYSLTAGSVYPQKKSAKKVSGNISPEDSASEILGDFTRDNISRNDLVKGKSGNRTSDIDYNQAYWSNNFNDKRVVRNDLTKSQKRPYRTNIEGGISNRTFEGNINPRQRRNFGSNSADTRPQDVSDSIKRRSEMQRNAQRINDNKGIDRFKQGVEQTKSGKSKFSDKRVKAKAQGAKESKANIASSERLKVKKEVEEQVKSSVKNLSEVKDKNGDNIKIKIKMHDDGSLYVQEPDNIPAWTDYKNALAQRAKVYREDNPEPPYSDDGSESESAAHAKWQRGFNQDQELYGDKTASKNEQVQIIKKAIKKAQEAINANKS